MLPANISRRTSRSKSRRYRICFAFLEALQLSIFLPEVAGNTTLAPHVTLAHKILDPVSSPASPFNAPHANNVTTLTWIGQFVIAGGNNG